MHQSLAFWRWMRVFTLLVGLRQGSLVHVPMLAVQKQSFSKYIDKTHSKMVSRAALCWMGKWRRSEKSKIRKSGTNKPTLGRSPAFLPGIPHVQLGPEQAVDKRILIVIGNCFTSSMKLCDVSESTRLSLAFRGYYLLHGKNYGVFSTRP